METRDLLTKLQESGEAVKSQAKAHWARAIPPLRRAGAFCNRFLPFTDPSASLTQDIIHTFVFCTALYYAPVLIERYTQRYLRQQDQETSPQAVQATASHDSLDELDHAEPQIDEIAEPEGLNALDAAVNLQARGNEPGIQDEFGAGRVEPNDAAAAVNSATSRNVGKKKAASIARKDQRRAYNEFHRAQGDAQRAREREEEAAMAAIVTKEKARRLAVETAVTKKAEEEKKKAKEQAELTRQREMGRRRAILDSLYHGLRKTNKIDLKNLEVMGKRVSLDEVERLANAEGLLGKKIGEHGKSAVIMITARGFLVCVEGPTLEQALSRAADEVDGTSSQEPISWDTSRKHVEDVMKTSPGTPARNGHVVKKVNIRELDLGSTAENPLQKMMKDRWA